MNSMDIITFNMISSSKIHKQKHTRQSFCEHRAIDSGRRVNRAVHVAQSDSGSDATTTNERGLLHEFKPIRFTKALRDAGGKAHVVAGEGKLKVPSDRR